MFSFAQKFLEIKQKRLTLFSECETCQIELVSIVVGGRRHGTV